MKTVPQFMESETYVQRVWELATGHTGRRGEIGTRPRFPGLFLTPYTFTCLCKENELLICKDRLKPMQCDRNGVLRSGVKTFCCVSFFFLIIGKEAVLGSLLIGLMFGKSVSTRSFTLFA